MLENVLCLLGDQSVCVCARKIVRIRRVHGAIHLHASVRVERFFTDTDNMQMVGLFYMYSI